MRQSYKIIGDSSTDLTSALKAQGNIITVPLTLQIDEEQIIDDENFNQAYLLDAMKNSKHTLKSACPSPDAYLAHFDDADDIFVITLSSQLSGSYNSAEVAKSMYLEEHPDKNICILDSKSASVGQTLLAMRIQELMEDGKSFQETCHIVTQYREEMATKFVLESLEVFRRNGRLSTVTAAICNTLNIKAVMTSRPDGSIDRADQARGMKKALENLNIDINSDLINEELTEEADSKVLTAEDIPWDPDAEEVLTEETEETAEEETEAKTKKSAFLKKYKVPIGILVIGCIIFPQIRYPVLFVICYMIIVLLVSCVEVIFERLKQ